MAFAHPHYQTHAPSHVHVVDSLRSIGILLVIWFHLWIQSWQSSNVSLFGKVIELDLLARNGQIGVEILLFVTGFGLFYPYATHWFEKTDLHSLKEYFYHRFIRIVPSYYLAVIAGLLLFTAESGLARQAPLWHLLTHLSFTHIFSPDAQASISVVFWTLGTEMSFYVVFPLLAWCFIKKPYATFIGMVVTAYVFRYWGIPHHLTNLPFWFRQMPSFLDVYACGMMTAYLLVWSRSQFNQRTIVLWTATGLSLISIFLFISLLKSMGTASTVPNGREIWLSNYRFLVGLIGMGFTLSTTLAQPLWQFLFTNKVIIFFSKISYNWYLWHYMILLEFKVKHFPNSSLNYQYDDPIWRIQYFWISAVSGLVIAILLTYLLERPLVKYGMRGFARQLLKIIMPSNKLVVK